ncbi:MAG: AEC family transporter [Pseudomonadota bacterium]
MLAIFLQTLPFFALIGIGFAAARTGFIPQEARPYLTTFVFYFALSAMLFRFASSLSVTQLWDGQFFLAYLCGCLIIYILTQAVGMIRGEGWAVSAIEAQCSIIGNVGFMGIPMLVLLFGEAAAGPVLFVLAIDLIVFGTLIVMSITASREGRISPEAIQRVIGSIFKNPMVMSIALGLAWGATGIATPSYIDVFLTQLAGAATPCALFVIGMSLASPSAERVSVALWLSFLKLAAFPVIVAIMSLVVFDVDPFDAAVMIAAAAMPTAGNIYIIAQHFSVAPERASSTIFISTVISIITLTLWIAYTKSEAFAVDQISQNAEANQTALHAVLEGQRTTSNIIQVST